MCYVYVCFYVYVHICVCGALDTFPSLFRSVNVECPIATPPLGMRNMHA